LLIHSGALAATYSRYIDHLLAKYGSSESVAVRGAGGGAHSAD